MSPSENEQTAEENQEWEQGQGPPPEFVGGENYLITWTQADDLIRMFAIGAGGAMLLLVGLNLWTNNLRGVFGHLIGLAWSFYILYHYRRIKQSPQVEINPGQGPMDDAGAPPGPVDGTSEIRYGSDDASENTRQEQGDEGDGEGDRRYVY